MPSNTLRLLFLGDIVGPLGRLAVRDYLSRNRFDFVVANGENATHGHGLCHAHYEELLGYGIDALTSGNHYFNAKDIFDPDLDYSRQVRPYNLDPHAPGVGSRVFTAKDGTPIRVSNFMGRVFLPMTQSNPFYGLDEVLRESREAIHLIDFHGEATAEKRLFAEYADGRVSAVIGTHTHVQTNDAQILRKGTFFLTDAGMNGALDSSIGDVVEPALAMTMTGIPHKFDVAGSGPYLINGVILTIDKASGKVLEATLVNERKEEGSL